MSGGMNERVEADIKEARHDLLDTIERLFDHVTEGFVAFLVAAEICILLTSIVMRCVVHYPLIWADELTSTFFLWMGMLGAVISLRRGQHMRMTTVIALCPKKMWPVLEAFAITAAIAFLALIIHPAYEYAIDELFITTPALEISNIWRASALPIGAGLMLIAACFRLLRLPNPGASITAVALTCAIAAVIWLVQPLYPSLGNSNLVLFFIVLLGGGVLAGIPIAFCFGLATFGYLALTTTTPLVVVVGRTDEGMSHFILLAVPMFIFLGVLIEGTGMAKSMIAFLASLLGHVRGGLSYVLIGAMYLVSGISGSKLADMAAVAPGLFPEMIKRGAKPGDLAALLSTTGAQTETIPPSIVLIAIGSVTGVSIAALFTGGLLPGFVVALFLCVVVWWRYRKEDLSAVVRAGRRDTFRAGIVALPALALPFVIRFAVVEGIATATEVSAIGILYSLIASAIFYKMVGLRRIYQMLVDTAALSGTILFIVGAATAMAWALAQSGFSRDLAQWLASLPGGSITFLLCSVLVFIVLGSLLEGLPAIVLFGPLLFPIARQMGVHEVHYAMVVILSMGIGLFSPPFGLGYYAACAIGRVDPTEGMRPIIAYMMALILGTLLIVFVPWFSIGFL